MVDELKLVVLAVVAFLARPLRSGRAPARQAPGGALLQLADRPREEHQDRGRQARPGAPHARRDARGVEARRLARADRPRAWPGRPHRPLPPDAAEWRRSRTGEPYRAASYSGLNWRVNDLPALGWRHRRHYDMRATFITLAIEDGADPEILENRVTHARQSRSAFDGYNRGPAVGADVRRVAKLRIARGARREAVSAVVGSDSRKLAAASASSDDSESDLAKRPGPDPRRQRAGLRSPARR
jgi:hypothetical protein